MLRTLIAMIRWWNAWWVRRESYWKGTYYTFAIAFVILSLTGGPETEFLRVVVAAASVASSVGMGLWFSGRFKRRLNASRRERRRD